MSTEVFQIVPPSSINAESPMKTKTGRVRRVYRCKHCGRLFKRSEHCARHERVHTNERPFPCSFCDRRYARKDLVKRHERSLHADAYRAAHPSEFANKSSPLSDTGALSKEESTEVKPPLTPISESLRVDCENKPDKFASSSPDIFPRPNPVLSAYLSDPVPLLRGQPSDLGQFSPPGSSQDQETIAQFDISLDPPFGETDPLLSGPDGINNAHRNNLGHWSEGQSPLQDSLPTAKRRRLEIDPLLSIGQPAGQPTTPAQHLSTAAAPFRNAFESVLADFTFAHGPTFPDAFTDFGVSSSTVYNPLQAFSGSHLDPLLELDFGDPFALSQVEHACDFPEGYPIIQKDDIADLPKFTFDEITHRRICDDAYIRLPTAELSEALFPSVAELDRFFGAYISSFHPHFPIIHLASLDLMETPSPLILAICSVGAMYQLERGRAKNFFALAGTMSSYALRGGLPIANGTPKPAPLWIMQTRVLLSLCGIFSEKSNVVMRTVENLGLFAIDYRLRRSSLNNEGTNPPPNWEEWISKESSKRLLCGMFIVSNLISTTFGLNPAFSHTHDLEFDVLDEERLWNAPSAKEWEKLREMQAPVGPHSVREAMTDLLFSSQPVESAQPYRISGFTMLVLMHAVNVHMWNLLQFTQMLSGRLLGASPSQSSLFSEALATLGKCDEVISRVRGRREQGSTWDETEGPLMFNCEALLRIAYIRVVSTANSFNRLTLLTDSLDDVVAAVKRYAEAPQPRNPFLTKSVTKALEGFLSPIKVGPLLVRKTAAQSWSVEHAVAGWDAALFLTKWVHTVELESPLRPPDDDESAVMEQLKALLVEAESDYDGTGSLAAAVAHVWSTFLNDVWVWGVTPRMGNILQELAVVYRQGYQERFGILM